MASIYKKPIVVTDPKTGEKVKKKSAKWWGRYRDALGRDRRVPLAKDKAAAQAMLNEIVQEVERERAGVSPKTAQTLARLSDINLTMNTYTMLEVYDQSVAVAALPPVPGGKKPECDTSNENGEPEESEAAIASDPQERPPDQGRDHDAATVAVDHQDDQDVAPSVTTPHGPTLGAPGREIDPSVVPTVVPRRRVVRIASDPNMVPDGSHRNGYSLHHFAPKGVLNPPPTGTPKTQQTPTKSGFVAPLLNGFHRIARPQRRRQASLLRSQNSAEGGTRTHTWFTHTGF